MDEILLQEITDNRRALHRIPERSLKEYNTAKYIKEKLLEYGLEVEEHLGGTEGLIGSIKINDGPSIAYRADMDALPVTEKTGYDFSSQNAGVMHACGHDGHMTMALALAKYCADNKSSLKENIIFVFQPGEEGAEGANKIMASNFLERYGVRLILGAHVSPEVNEGRMASLPGATMAAIRMFSVEFTGKSAHSATPQCGNDALIAACHYVVTLQSLLTRTVDPKYPTTMNIGKIQSGEVDNIVSPTAKVFGNLRSLSSENFRSLGDSVANAANTVAATFGCTANVVFGNAYPVVDNDKELYEIFKKAVGESYEDIKPQMISEDFSFFQQAVPGLFVFVGIRNEEADCVYSLHSDKFQMREEALYYGVEAFKKMFAELGVIDKEI